MGSLFIFFAVYSLTFTSVLKRPFSTFDNNIGLSCVVCAGCGLFNAFQCILCKNLNKENFANLFKDFMHVIFLLTVVYTKENGLVGVVILLAYGSSITSGAKKAAEFHNRQTNCYVRYKLALVADLTVQVVFNIAIPIFISGIVVVLGEETFATMQHTPTVAFCTGIILYVIFITIYIKYRVYVFMHQYAWLRLTETNKSLINKLQMSFV